MELDQNQITENQQPVQSTPFESQESGSGVSFPTVGGEKKSGGAKTLLIVGILVLVGILGFVIYKSASKKSDDLSVLPSPFDNLTTPSTVQTQTVAPSSTPVAALDRSKVQIQIQNGTGTPGDAAYLQTQLTNLGYANIKTGNSDSIVTTTTVTFSSTLNSSFVAEITQKLNSLYQTVTTSTSPTATFDVIVVTGTKKGATPKPVATATASPSASPSSTPL